MGLVCRMNTVVGIGGKGLRMPKLMDGLDFPLLVIEITGGGILSVCSEWMFVVFIIYSIRTLRLIHHMML